MTLGEKLKEARKKAGLSQDEFAQKLKVSRSAVAKWESDRGMPDIENLKSIAQLLNISVDYLIHEEYSIDFNELKEMIDLTDFNIDKKFRSKKDAAVFSKYPDATYIYPLIRTKKLSKLEWIIDFIIQPGSSQIVDYANDSSAYYVVENKDKRCLVKITNEFIISTEISKSLSPKKFVIGKNQYKKAAYIIK